MDTYLNSIISYRNWHVSSDYLLCSLNTKEAWQPGREFRASCNKTLLSFLGVLKMVSPWVKAEATIHGPELVSPVLDCNCGIYGSKLDYWNVDEYRYHFTVFGKMMQWGKIVEHEKGYRSEFAYPISIEGFICSTCDREQYFDKTECYFTSTSAYKPFFYKDSSANEVFILLCNRCTSNRKSTRQRFEIERLRSKYGIDWK